jgi:hypothetical protein
MQFHLGHIIEKAIPENFTLTVKPLHSFWPTQDFLICFRFASERSTVFPTSYDNQSLHNNFWLKIAHKPIVLYNEGFGFLHYSRRVMVREGHEAQSIGRGIQ